MLGLSRTKRTAALVSDLELIPTVLDADDARTYSRFTSRPTRCLVKVDVGLQRLGVYPEDVVLLARTLIDLPRIEFQGLYTQWMWLVTISHTSTGNSTGSKPFLQRFQRPEFELR
jgi:alanine racemase